MLPLWQRLCIRNGSAMAPQTLFTRPRLIKLADCRLGRATTLFDKPKILTQTTLLAKAAF